MSSLETKAAVDNTSFLKTGGTGTKFYLILKGKVIESLRVRLGRDLTGD